MKRKPFSMKKKNKLSRKSQNSSDISQSELKLLSKDNSSSIEQNMISENSKARKSSIVERSNIVKNSWSNSNSTKALNCSWTEVQTKNTFVDQSSVWQKKNH